MSRKDLADAFNLLAEAAVKVAIELEAIDAPAAGTPPPAPSSAAGSSVSGPVAANLSELLDAGECPKHRRLWKPSKFEDGAGYCTAKSDDPAWSKNGYCSITSKSASKWLEIQGAAAA